MCPPKLRVLTLELKVLFTKDLRNLSGVLNPSFSGPFLKFTNLRMELFYHMFFSIYTLNSLFRVVFFVF